ncbi:MAG: hypothetical protein NTX03_01835 [Bacteroidetes bacterium]|nr:hypothetical protein [Bacteroidota bacterium]
MADDIDPKREHPNLPLTSHRLILTLGTESEIFSRTFLQAKRLFREEYLPSTIDAPQTLWLTLELVQEIAVLDKEIKDYIAAEKEVSAHYEDRKIQQLDHATPAIPDIKTRCKTIFKKADQAYQAQLELLRIFYPDFSKQSFYTNFFEFIKTKYGAQDQFTIFVQDALPFIMLVRNIRNCLDHRRTETVIKDFELQANSNIISPTIEVDHLGSKLTRMSLSQFLPSVTENLVAIFEKMIAFLTAKNLKTDRILPWEVRFISVDKRINKHIKYAYWSPLGSEGYYVL